MAIGTGGSGRQTLTEINVTPLVDVMLVLLIIFMVAAPLLTTGVSVDLPQTSASALNVEKKPVALSLNDQGQLYLMDQPIADADLVPKLQATSQNDPDQRIYVRASKVVPYGRVAQIMASVTQAGFKKVALVTEPTSQ